MKPTRILLVLGTTFAISRCFSVGATPIAECEPIRPPGLTPEQVDQIVIEKVSEVASLTQPKIDKALSIDELSSSGNAMMVYAYVVVGVSDSLGFNMGEVFDAAAMKKGNAHPSKSLTITELQSLSRKTYLSVPDAPFPAVKPGARYGSRRFVASVPSPSTGWLTVQCYSSRLTFLRPHATTGDMSSAMVSQVDLEPFKNDAEFLARANEAFAKNTPPNMIRKSISSEILKQPGPPCVLLEVHADIKVVPSVDSNSKPYASRVRFCYDAKFPYLGYMTGYSHLGSISLETFRERAKAFFDGVVAAR